MKPIRIQRKRTRGWQPIETAPKDGTIFLSLNYDNEVWVSMYEEHGRICFRMNRNYEGKKYTIHKINGMELLEEDKEYAEANERWESYWTMWTRGYEIKPTHWMPLPPPPAGE